MKAGIILKLIRNIRPFAPIGQLLMSPILEEKFDNLTGIGRSIAVMLKRVAVDQTQLDDDTVLVISARSRLYIAAALNRNIRFDDDKVFVIRLETNNNIRNERSFKRVEGPRRLARRGPFIVLINRKLFIRSVRHPRPE